MSITTTCKNCVWALYDGRKQVGCSVGKLEKYKNVCEVVQVDDKEKEFFTIPERICQSLRNKDWKDFHTEKGHNLLEVLEKETTVKTEIVVYVHSTNYSLVNFTNTLFSIREQTIPFHKVRIIVDEPDEELVEEVLGVVRDEFDDLPWTIDHNAEHFDRLKCMNMAVDKCSGFLMAFVNADFYVEPSFNCALNDYVKELYQFFAILPRDDDWNGFVTPASIFQFFGGHSEKESYLEIAWKIAEAGGHEPSTLLPTWENVWSIYEQH